MAYIYTHPQYRGIPEVGAANNDNEFTATFNICVYPTRTIVESVDLQFETFVSTGRGTFTNHIVDLGSIGGELEVYSTEQEDICAEFLSRWDERFRHCADDSVVGIYYIIREVVRKGRFIECI